MSLFLTQVLNGLVYSSILFLMSIGLSMIFGLMGVINLMHGSFFMLGAFMGLSVEQWTGNFWLALLFGPLPVLVLAVAVEMGALRRFYARSHLDQVLLTFGFAFAFADLVKLCWGNDVQSLAPPESLSGIVEIFGDVFPTYRLVLLGAGVIIAVALWLLLDRTRFGTMVRAGVDDSRTALGLGINVPLVFTVTFACGAALAAFAGVLAGPVLGVYPGLDVDVLIPSFIVIVIGGMGSFKGCVVSSLLVGLTDTFGRAYLPGTAMVSIYLVMILVLLVRPNGLFGIIQGGEARTPTPLPVSGLPDRATTSPLLWGLLVVALLCFVPLGGRYVSDLASEVLIFAIAALGLNLLLGYTGLISYGHAAYFGLGAYATLILSVHLGWNPWLAFLAGIAVATAAAIAIGLFVVRLSGVTFLMVTLAFAQLIFSVSMVWRPITGGSDGIGGMARPHLGPWSLGDPSVMFYVALFATAAVYLLFGVMLRSQFGHALIGLRENELRLRSMGFPARLMRLVSFVLAGALAGLAGGLYAFYNVYASPETLSPTMSGDLIMMVVLGGAGTLFGPAVGSAIFLLTKYFISTQTDHWMLVVGVIFIACIMFFRQGIYGTALVALGRALARKEVEINELTSYQRSGEGVRQP
jgi:branched-chain amino acid transport system permease protein